MATTYEGQVNIQSGLTVLGTTNLLGAVNIGGAGLTDDSIAASAEIAASKQEHRFCLYYDQVNGSSIVAATRMIHIARMVGRAHSIIARVTTKPTGGDLAFTIDLERAVNGSGTWATMLIAPISFSSADTDNTLKVGTLTVPSTLALGDALRLVVAVTGTTGTQGQGVVVSVEVDESGI